MPIHYHRIAAQFFNRPLLLTPASAETIGAYLLARMAGGPGSVVNDDSGESREVFAATERPDGNSAEMHTSRASRFYGETPVENGRPRPYRRTQDGTAIMSVIGELVNRGAWVGASSGLVSYEGLKYQLMQAASDQRVKNILLDLESPGGEAIGAFEMADVVRRVAAEKPVTALVNGMMASAAYAMGAGATRIVTIPTGLSGSIGVVMMHLDMSAALEKKGIKPTLIYAGAHKVDGNPLEPLPDSVRSDMQAEVNSFYDQFVKSVASGRSKMTEQAIRDTEARIYMGADAVAAGLADSEGTFEEVLAELSQTQAGRNVSTYNKERMMTDRTTNEPQATTVVGIPQADHDRAVAAARAEGVTEGRAAGVAEASARIAGILDHAEAQGREPLARHLAFKTGMSVEDATAALAASPKAVAAAAPQEQPKPTLGQRMQQETPPKLGAPQGAAAEAVDARERGRLIAMRAKGKQA